MDGNPPVAGARGVGSQEALSAPGIGRPEAPGAPSPARELPREAPGLKHGTTAADSPAARLDLVCGFL